jgi:hypothetical protein
MKRIAIMVLAAFFMSASVPAFSAVIDHQKEYSCKVEAMKCMSDLDVVQAKMKKMNESVESGATYSEADMNMLKKKISELSEAIDRMKPQPAK